MPPKENQLRSDASGKKRFVQNEEPIKFAHRLFLKQVAIRSGLEPLIFLFSLFLPFAGSRNDFSYPAGIYDKLIL